ncbi:uncharacterized protein LOC135379038 [Ornithodoros turicata]|uniref:uncharacterized protein LOC135379038 n=1 Tax=Ornithodoros turicata TaxID=34597 RepID=UPI003139BC4A
MLKESIQEMAKTLSAMHKAVPEIFDHEETEARYTTRPHSQKQRAANIRTAKNAGLKRILNTHKNNNGVLPESQNSQLVAMREKNKNLKIQLAKVQEELEKERELCRGLQEVLLKKFDIVPLAPSCPRCAQQGTPPGSSTFLNLRAALQIMGDDQEAGHAESTVRAL